MKKLVRRAISATNPQRFAGDCAVLLKVWFEEWSEPIPFVADPFDVELHGRLLWIRAMAGEFGEVEIIHDHRRWLKVLYGIPKSHQKLVEHIK